MNNRFLLFFIAFIISSLSVQKIEAQEKKKLLNGNVFIEVKNIQKRFSDSISHYDYKKNSVLYSEKYKVFYSEKIQNLKNLYQTIYDKDVIIGKINTGISFKTTSGVQVESNRSEAGTPPVEEVKNNTVDIAQVENYKQLEDLKKQLTTDFPVYLVEDYEGKTYRCKLNFVVDVDGKFKHVKYSGSSDTEFSIISALFLYAIGSLEKPLYYNKLPLVQNFSQPIVLRFE